MYVVQQVRSHYTHLVQKEDIWDSKHLFRNETKKSILKYNMKSETIEELTEQAKADIKRWVQKEKPAYYTVDGPWQTFVRRRTYHKRLVTMKIKDRDTKFLSVQGTMLLDKQIAEKSDEFASENSEDEEKTLVNRQHY